MALFPLVAGDLAEFVQEPRPGELSGVSPIAIAHLFKVFVSGWLAHGSSHAPRCPLL